MNFNEYYFVITSIYNGIDSYDNYLDIDYK